MNGSAEFALIWSTWDMPSGVPICRLRASARRISDSGFSGWPTTQSRDGANSRGGMAEMTGGRRRNLDDYVELTGWPTPRTQSSQGDREDRGAYAGPDLQTVAGWATPTQRDHKDGASTLENVPINGLLGRQVSAAGWATPQSRDGAHNRSGDPRRKTLNNDADLSGPVPSGSPASTEKRGALNPAFSLWLMGFPVEWENYAPQATRSSRKPPPSSSAP